MAQQNAVPSRAEQTQQMAPMTQQTAQGKPPVQPATTFAPQTLKPTPKPAPKPDAPPAPVLFRDLASI